MDLLTLQTLKEGSKLEIKNGSGGVPRSLWETYSAFANTDGGTILIGLEEKKSGSYVPVMLDNPEQIVQNLWDTLNNKQKVNRNILVNNHIRIEYYENIPIVIIEVPRANREDRPIYINDDLMSGTYRRNGEGDYRCGKEEVQMMLRDATTESLDLRVIESLGLDALCKETIENYRTILRMEKPSLMWNGFSDEEFLYRINAIRRGMENNIFHPTLAGLLMFGYHHTITQELPYYFLDYQEKLDSSNRWTSRITSDSGTWSGNVYDFYRLVSPKLGLSVKNPFKLIGASRVDDTPVHKAVRESLVNTLVHANYYERRGLTVENLGNGFRFSNPGLMRVSVNDAIQGGLSDPRNPTLFTMFTLINLGERAGSGLSSIYSLWKQEGWEDPKITQETQLERTVLELSLHAKDDSYVSDSTPSGNLPSQILQISDYAQEHGQVTNSDVRRILDVKQSRAHEILNEMVASGILKAEGTTRSRVYTIVS